MHVVSSSPFRVLCFPHQGKIVTIDQLSFFAPSSSEGNVCYVEHTSIPYENVGVGLFKDPALMGVFLLPPPNVASINMISINSYPLVIHPFDQVYSWGDVKLLGPTKLNYVEIILASTSSSDSTPSSRSLDTYVQSPWLGGVTSPNTLCDTFLSIEFILETLSFEDPPWDGSHHNSSFLPSFGAMTVCLNNFVSHVPSQLL